MLFDEMLRGYATSSGPVEEYCSFENYGEIEAMREFCFGIISLREAENYSEKKALEYYADAKNGTITMESFNNRLVALQEGVVGDVWDKIKQFFVKLWAKIKGWFKSLWKWIKDLFTSDEKWFSQNKTLIDDRGDNEVNVDTYEYLPKNIEKVLNGLQDSISIWSDEVLVCAQSTYYAFVEKLDDFLKDEVDKDAVEEAIGKYLGVDIGSEGIGGAVKDYCRGDKYKRDVTVDDMVALYEDLKKNDKSLNNASSKVDKLMNKANRMPEDARKGARAAEKFLKKRRQDANKDTDEQRSADRDYMSMYRKWASYTTKLIRWQVEAMQTSIRAAISVSAEGRKFALSTIRRGANMKKKED